MRRSRKYWSLSLGFGLPGAILLLNWLVNEPQSYTGYKSYALGLVGIGLLVASNYFSRIFKKERRLEGRPRLRPADPGVTIALRLPTRDGDNPAYIRRRRLDRNRDVFPLVGQIPDPLEFGR